MMFKASHRALRTGMIFEIVLRYVIRDSKDRELSKLRARNCQDRENYEETPLHPKTPFRCDP